MNGFESRAVEGWSEQFRCSYLWMYLLVQLQLRNAHLGSSGVAEVTVCEWSIRTQRQPLHGELELEAPGVEPRTVCLFEVEREEYPGLVPDSLSWSSTSVFWR